MKVIVAGADGFIGRHLCRAMSEKGLTVVAVTLPGSPLQKTILGLDGVTVVESDYSSASGLASLLPADADALVDLAWAGVSPEARQDFELQLGNVDLSLRILRAAIANGVRKFLLPGSTLEYSLGDRTIDGLHDVPTPQNSYSSAKIASKFLCEQLARANDIAFVYMIFAGSYGVDRRDKNVIFYVIDELLHGRSPELTGLKQHWNYIHIDDLVRGILSVVEHGHPWKTYPIGGLENMPLSEFVKIIHRLIDVRIPLGIGKKPYPHGKLPISCLDNTVTTRDTGFIPQVPFAQGISEVIANYRKELMQ